jgi:hypothetical protein
MFIRKTSAMATSGPLLAGLGLTLLLAGCLGAPGATPSTAPTATPPGSPGIDFPDGPKSAPDRPAALTESSVSEYVRTYEYNYVYNNLWQGQYSVVSLLCQVDDTSGGVWGYDVVVTCTGSSTTSPPAGSTATPGMHRDWFTQSFRYSVSNGETTRVAVEDREQVP